MRTRLLVVAAVVITALVLAACNPIVPPPSSDPDTSTKTDLRAALAAEKVAYSSTGQYTAYAPTLRAIDGSLDWGGRLWVQIGNVHAPGDDGIVCIQERSDSGTTLSIADIAFGQWQGTYYGKYACPSNPNEATIGSFWTGW